MTDTDWAKITSRSADHTTWVKAKQGALVASLGLARVREILASDAQRAVDGLIARDQALEGAANAIVKVEKLVRFRRDLGRDVNAFQLLNGRRSKKGHFKNCKAANDSSAGNTS